MNKSTRVIYPFLFSVFPVVFLYSQNVGEVAFLSFFWPTVIIPTLSAILLALTEFCHVNKHKAGLIVSGFWGYFFMYSNVSSLFREVTLFGLDLYRHSYILSVWTALFAVYALVVLKWKYDLVKITKIFNVVALCLIVTSSIMIASGIANNIILKKSGKMSNLQNIIDVPSALPSDLPDIYYIILDQHVSNDVLETYFDFDNSSFAEGLRERGFYFAEKSRSNYTQTRLSLASSLNLQYMDILADHYGSDTTNTTPMLEMIKRNRLTNFLKACGYKIATFSSSYHSTELKNSDVFFSATWTPDEYLAKVLGNTVFLPMMKHSMTYQGHRRQILYPLENISKVTELDSPVFTFIHIVCPHPPYVFDENGNEISEDREFSFSGSPDISVEVRNKKYLGQVKFIDRKITEAIDVILSKSDKPPIIILQSDHGARWRFGPPGSDIDYKPYYGILNAYYLPGLDQTKLYDSITPVNSFRVVLDHYFGTDMDLLEDKTYYSTYKNPYDFTDTTKESDRTISDAGKSK